MAADSKQKSSLFSPKNLYKKNRLRALLDNVFVQFVAFAIFVVAIVAILAGGVEDPERTIDESMIGQVAPFSVEATRDFTFAEVDVEASTELREEIAQSVPAVYDWQEGLSDTVQGNISVAFAAMRSLLADEAYERVHQDDPQRIEQIEGRTDSESLRRRALIDTLSFDDRLQIAHSARRRHFDAHLGSRISEQDFEAFARQGFPVDVEDALRRIINDVMSELIVANIEAIEHEQGRGIYLRRLRNDQALIEYHITDIDGRFVGYEEVSHLIEQSSRSRAMGITGADLRQSIVAAAAALVEPNTRPNEAKTLEKRQAARDSVAEQVLRHDFREGQILLEAGHIITERDIRLVEEMTEGDDSYGATQLLSGIALFGLLLLTILYGFGRRNIRAFKPGPRDIVFMATTLLIMLLITRVGTILGHALAEQSAEIPVEAWYLMIPMAAGGMLIRLVLDTEHAVIFTILFAVLVGVVTGNSLFFAAYTIMGTLVGITTVQQVKHRMALMWSGLAVGGVNALAIVGFLLIQGELFQMATFAHILLGFGGGAATGFFILAVLPVFESVFGYTTDIKLLELANLNQPLLRDLILRAPGSYHHSMMVGSLCEAAAEAIGANALLARVGSYYHDIGKGKNPQYFAENQKGGVNPHDKLKPNMSALIIKSHVKDGVEMGRRHRLPDEIVDFIAQHHGTSLIAYFYHKAKQAEDPDIPEVDEKDFRYPGPRPQSRETAICLLADGVEAASRAMPNPSPARLKGLVQTMINRAFTDGQLDECDLTLKDLNKIAHAFTRILSGIYHQRPEYPGEKKPARDKSGAAPKPQKPRAERKQTSPREQTLADSSSDVWEIAEEEKTKEQGGDANRRDGDSSNGKQSPRKDGDRGPQETPRDGLPRLGSSH